MNGLAPQRVEIYRAIDGERTYQDGWKDPTLTDSHGLHSMQEFLTYIDSYTKEAIEVGCRRPYPQAKDFQRHAMRKIAALAVAAMEQHGIAVRVPTDNLKQRHA